MLFRWLKINSPLVLPFAMANLVYIIEITSNSFWINCIFIYVSFISDHLLSVNFTNKSLNTQSMLFYILIFSFCLNSMQMGWVLNLFLLLFRFIISYNLSIFCLYFCFWFFCIHINSINYIDSPLISTLKLRTVNERNKKCFQGIIGKTLRNFIILSGWTYSKKKLEWTQPKNIWNKNNLQIIV